MFDSLIQDFALNQLPEGWTIKTLEDVCDGVFDCPHSTPKLNDEGPYLVRTQDIRKGFFDYSQAVKVSNETYLVRIKRAEPKVGDLLFSREGTYFGDAAEVPVDTKVCLGQRMVLIRPDQSILRSTYLRIWINSSVFQRFLLRFRDGTVAERLNLSVIRKLPVLIPDMEYQNKIVKHIVPLEDKVAVSRQTNQTLEQIAQAIFKSWFVDFEPVKAKIQAKQNGQDPERAAMCAISGKSLEELEQLSPETRQQLKTTAALFPDTLVESEFGEIPEGWGVESFSKLARLDTTSVKPNNEPDKIWEHYSIPAFDVNKSPVFEPGEEIKSNKYKVDKNSILSSKLNPHFPRTWWPDIEDADAAICSTEFMQFIPHNINHRAFILDLILSQPFQEGISQRVTGSTGSRQRAQPPQVANMDVVIPKKDLIDAYSNYLTSFSVTKAKNVKENLTLAKMRKTLLPKLLSGEITIGNTESTAEVMA